MANGANQNARTAFLESLADIGGTNDPTIHLIDSSTETSDTDGSSGLTSNHSVTVSKNDFTVKQGSPPGPDATSSTLTNSSELDLGSPSGFTVEEIVLQSGDNPDQFVTLENVSGDLDLSGSGSVKIQANALEFTYNAG